MIDEMPITRSPCRAFTLVTLDAGNEEAAEHAADAAEIIVFSYQCDSLHTAVEMVADVPVEMVADVPVEMVADVHAEGQATPQSQGTDYPVPCKSKRLQGIRCWEETRPGSCGGSITRWRQDLRLLPSSA